MISYNDIAFSMVKRPMIHHSKKSDFLFWMTSWRKCILCCKIKEEINVSDDFIINGRKNQFL